MKSNPKGHAESVKAIGAGANADKVDVDCNKALIEEAREGHSEMVKALIAAGADINKADIYGYTALMWAVRGGQSEAVEALIEAGADVNQLDNNGRTALIYAVRRGHTEMVKVLIVAGTDVNISGFGRTALIEAAEAGHTEIVENLIAVGADINKVTEYGFTASMLAARAGHTEIVNYLIVAGAGVNIATQYGHTALILAVQEGHTEIMGALIEAGADINKVNKYGHTALTEAAQKGHVETVRTLIEAGAYVHKGGGNNGNRALIYTAFKGNTKMVKALIAAGADVNAIDYGETALMDAVRGGQSETVEALIAAGADVNRVDQHSRTALMNAAREGHTEIVKALIEAGADVDAKDSHGYTTLTDAARKGHTEIVKALIAAGENVNQIDNNGETALMRAADQGHTETVKALLDAGADVDPKNNHGDTAFMYAELTEHGEIMTAIDAFTTAYPTIIAIQNKMSELAITSENAQEKTEEGYTTLMAAFASDNIALAKKLLDYGADIDAQDAYSRTALSCAVSTTMVMDFITNREKLGIKRAWNIKDALGGVHGGYLVLRRAVKENNQALIQLILKAVPEIVRHNNSLLSLSEDMTVIRLLSRYGIGPPSNSVLQPHIQQEVIIQHILASTPWSYAQGLTMTVGDVKAWMRDYANMLPKASDHIYHISAIDQETVQKIQACEDDTMKATEFLADDRLLYTVYCAKVVRKIREEMSLDTMTLASLIESKMYLEHGYVEQALDSLLGTSEVIDVHIASYRIEPEKVLLPLMTRYASSHDERLLKFLKLFMQDSITTDSKKSGDYQVLLALTDEIIIGVSDARDKLRDKAEDFRAGNNVEEGVFGECLEECMDNWQSDQKHVASSDVRAVVSSHSVMFSVPELPTVTNSVSPDKDQKEKFGPRL